MSNVRHPRNRGPSRIHKFHLPEGSGADETAARSDGANMVPGFIRDRGRKVVPRDLAKGDSPGYQMVPGSEISMGVLQPPVTNQVALEKSSVPADLAHRIRSLVVIACSGPVSSCKASGTARRETG
jgi:hypothetical protein